ncbi:MAG: hypothetical protein AVDCRST_MAG93-3637 [uncultured Chloroflexia bacterium]|uniref:Uncharacterized protein n=1 Tax=uncultured Chloroflexia bacterium TaxID=1672391 RepID=A0A6J4JTS4_9CHLR|nr:MAG: hypothetical protein AVDCRST_MAG93-3637 [uncultured Chloroflexia bacterium]
MDDLRPWMSLVQDLGLRQGGQVRWLRCRWCPDGFIIRLG